MLITVGVAKVQQFFKLPKKHRLCGSHRKQKNKKNNSKMAKFKYKEQHAIIIKVSSEQEQKELFEKLQKMGFTNLKVVSV